MADEAGGDELGALAAALTGDPEAAAALLGATLARRDARRSGDEAALRSVLVQQYLRRPPPVGPPDTEGLPDELRAVADRLAPLRPVDRAALVLVRLTGLTLGETAGLLDQTPTALRRRLEATEAGLGADAYAVRAALEALSWRVADPAAVAAARYRAEQAGRRRRGRTRLVAVALGLALLAALAVPTFRMVWPLPARTTGDWQLGLELDRPAGWQELLHVVTPDQEYLQVHDVGECSVVASLPGAPASERREPPEQTERVWVDGRPLRFVETYEGGGPTVWWTYADGGEVSLTCTAGPDDRATVLDMAARLRFSTGRPLRLPMTLERVPAGFRVAGAGTRGERPLIALLSGSDLRRGEVGALVGVEENLPPVGTRVDVGGTEHTLVVENRSVRLCRAVRSRAVCVDTYAGSDGGAQGRAVGRATDLAKEVAGHLRLAPDLDDESTWFDARDALPS